MLDELSKMLIASEKPVSFKDVKKDDYVHVVDIKTNEIHIGCVTDVTVEHAIKENYTMLGLSSPEAITSVKLTIDRIPGLNEKPFTPVCIIYGDETFTICHMEGIVICTTRREAEKIQSILGIKCGIQYDAFKSIFNLKK